MCRVESMVDPPSENLTEKHNEESLEKERSPARNNIYHRVSNGRSTRLSLVEKDRRLPVEQQKIKRTSVAIWETSDENRRTILL